MCQKSKSPLPIFLFTFNFKIARTAGRSEMKSPPRPPRPARPVTRPAKPPSKLVHAAKVRHHNKSALIRRESSRRRGAFGEEEDGVAAVPPFMIPTERAERWKTFIQCIVPWEPRRVEQEVVLGTRPLELPLPPTVMFGTCICKSLTVLISLVKISSVENADAATAVSCKD